MWEGGLLLLKRIPSDRAALRGAKAIRETLTHVYDYCDLI